MRNPLKTENSHGLGMLAARIPMGVFFLVLGYGKFHGGVDSFVSTFIGPARHAEPAPPATIFSFSF